MSFFSELRRRNVFKVAAAYAIVGWLLIQVADVALPAFDAPDWVLQVFIFFVVLGFPVALLLSWAYELTPEGVKRTESVPLSESISSLTGRRLDFTIIGLLALAVVFMFVDKYLPESGPFAGAEIDPAFVESAPEERANAVTGVPPTQAREQQTDILPNSVAVLPFENLSPDPDNAYFAAGIHEEILNQLAKLRNLSVISRTSVLRYAGRDLSIPEIADELNVEAVMEGSVRYAGDRVRISAQLIDAATDEHLWSEVYERSFSDVFAIQADIAMNIANALQTQFSLSEQESLEKIPTESPAAYALYLRALSDTTEQSVSSDLDQAIELDPDFALAYARRAWYYTWNVLGGTATSPGEAEEIATIVRDSANRALMLDSTLGLAHAALADLHLANWRGAEAEEAFRHAYELNPSPEVIMDYGRFKRHRGEYDEAVALLERAVQLDPRNPQFHIQLALAYSRMKNHDAAAMAFQRALELLPTQEGALSQLALTEIARGNRNAAVRYLQTVEEITSNPFRLSLVALAYSHLDRRDDVLRIVDQFEKLAAENPVGDAVWARVYIALGDRDQALTRLQSALSERALTDLTTLTELAANPWGDAVLDEPEFREVLSGLWN